MVNMLNSVEYRLERPSSPVAEVAICILPFVSGIYYFLSLNTVVYISRRRAHQDEMRKRLLLRKIALWSMMALLVTYVLESTSLLFLFTQQTMALAEDVIYPMGSVILWSTLILDFSRRTDIPSISLGGCSSLYLVLEVFLLVSPAHPQRQGQPSAITFIAIRVLRLGIIGLLTIIAGGSCVVPYQRRRIEEEDASLLPDGTACGDIVRERQSRSMNYGATVQQTGHTQNDLWSCQARMRPPTTRPASRRMQLLPALQGIEEEAQVEENDAVAEIGDPQSSVDDAPALRVAKLRRKRKEPTLKHQSRQRQKDTQLAESPSKINSKDNISSRKSMWKPDAPEFIPKAQRGVLAEQVNEVRGDEVERQDAAGQEYLLELDLGQEPILPRTTNVPTAMKGDPKLPITNENGSPWPTASKKHGNRAVERGHDHSASVLQQASNGVVYAYPKKKSRKRGKWSRRETNLRRKRTESEPAGIGLNSQLDSL